MSVGNRVLYIYYSSVHHILNKTSTIIIAGHAESREIEFLSQFLHLCFTLTSGSFKTHLLEQSSAHSLVHSFYLSTQFNKFCQSCKHGFNSAGPFGL